MKIFDNFNIFKKNEQLVGLSSFKQEQKEELKNPKIFTGDYASRFQFNLDRRINPSVGQNLYFLS